MNRRDFLLAAGCFCGSAFVSAKMTQAALIVHRKKELEETARGMSIPHTAFADAFCSLLLFMKTQSDMVCLGDTEHGIPASHAFLFNSEVVDKLAQGGYRNVFYENNIRAQGCLDILQTKDRLWENVEEACEKTLYVNSYIPEEDRSILTRRMVHALQGRDDLRFYSVDTRLYDPPEGVEQGGYVIRAEKKLDYDDASTAAFIKDIVKKRQGGNLCCFGCAHFDNSTAGWSKTPYLYGLFEKEGLRPLTVNLYASLYRFENAVERYQDSKIMRAPDVMFCIDDSKKHVVQFKDERLEQAFAAWKEQQTKAPLTEPSRRSFLSALVHAL